MPFDTLQPANNYWANFLEPWFSIFLARWFINCKFGLQGINQTGITTWPKPSYHPTPPLSLQSACCLNVVANKSGIIYLTQTQQDSSSWSRVLLSYYYTIEANNRSWQLIIPYYVEVCEPILHNENHVTDS